jgi:short-subunit dehydrogenase
VLVNNAGLAGFGLFEVTSLKNMKGLFDVNLFGVVRTYQAVLPSISEHKSGLIINISGGFGIFASPFVVVYQMTKFGLDELTEGVRHEVKDYAIDTVSIFPGPFLTEIGCKTGFGADKKDILDAYGPDVQKSFEQFGGIMYGKMTEYKSHPQMVADGVLKLISMKNGTRPYRAAINPISGEIEKEYADFKLPVKTIWLKKLG